MPTTHALDLSHHNTITSWDAIKSAGVIGVIHKSTEGSTYIDATYATRHRAATTAGLKWGAYHFLKHGNCAAQMEHFVKNAGLPPGSRAAIDYEDPACTLDDLKLSIEAIEAIDETLEIAVYSGHLVKDQVGTKKVPWLEPTSLWLAQYTTGKPSWPKQIWPTYSLWQFTDKGKIAGVSGNVDLNTFAGTPEQCAKWFGPVEGESIPAPIKTVHITVDAPEGVQIMVNGVALS